MKYKWVRLNQYLFFDNELIEILEDYSRQGWKLKSTNPFFFVFEPCDKALKYAIDYNELDDEYLQVIQDLGYEHIYSHRFMHIYANEQLNAVDLHTDKEVHDRILLRRYYSLRSFYGLLLLGIILMIMGGYFGQVILKRDLHFYRHYHDMFIAFVCLLGGIASLFHGFYIYKRRQAIYQQNYSFARFNKYRIVNRLLWILSLIALFLLFKNILNSLLLVITVICIWGIPCYISDYLVPNQKQKWKKWLLTGLSMLLFLVSYIGFYDMNKTNDHQGNDVPVNFPEQDVLNIVDNRYLYNITFFSDFFDCPQEYFICKDDDVNQTVFKELIVDTELFIRELSQAQVEEFNGETFYDIPTLKKKPYSQAMKVYQKMNSQYFKECYVLKDYVIARNQNIIVRLLIKGNVEETLRQYSQEKLKL